jgi:hypothetical protein
MASICGQTKSQTHDSGGLEAITSAQTQAAKHGCSKSMRQLKITPFEEGAERRIETRMA